MADTCTETRHVIRYLARLRISTIAVLTAETGCTQIVCVELPAYAYKPPRTADVGTLIMYNRLMVNTVDQ